MPDSYRLTTKKVRMKLTVFWNRKKELRNTGLLLSPSLTGDLHDADSHAIHPITLDGFFQLIFAAASKGGMESLPTMIPTRIQRFWLSNTGLGSKATGAIKLYVKTQLGGYQRHSTILGFGKDDDCVRIVSEGFELMNVASRDELS